MNELVGFLAFVLSAMGLTVLVVWPDKGLGAILRDRVLRPLLPGRTKGVLDCYVCLGFWSGAVLSPAFWGIYREPWCWFGCLIVPCVFWWILRDGK